MSSSTLKIIACIVMLIDHTGALLFPEILLLRIIGRLAFPIFAFLITEGYSHTSDKKKYLFRLIAFAFLSEAIFDMALFGEWLAFGYQNIFFTLSIGLAGIWMYDSFVLNNRLLAYLAFVVSMLAAIYMKTDYSAMGVLTVFVFHLYKNNKVHLIIGTIIVNSIFPIINIITYKTFNIYTILQLFAVFSLLIIFNYNGSRGYRLKYFFYLFYPGHLLVLILIKNYF